MAKDTEDGDQPKKDAPKPSKREQKAQKLAKEATAGMRELAKGDW